VNHLRYIELCGSGPPITKEDRKRLAGFVPAVNPMATAVCAALTRMHVEALTARHRSKQCEH
jgi:hypothetical protein